MSGLLLNYKINVVIFISQCSASINKIKDNSNMRETV